MWSWIGILLAIVAVLGTGGYLLRGWMIRTEAERQSRIEAEARRHTERIEQEHLEKEQAEAERLQALDDATLFGEPGESLHEAADRLGVVIRTETDAMYYCRYGNHAYTVEKDAINPSASGGRVAFRMVDPQETYPAGELGLGVGGTNSYGWRVVREFTQPKPPHDRLFEGDDIAYVTLMIDLHGRIMEQLDHTNARWHWMSDPATGKFVLGWEEMLDG